MESKIEKKTEIRFIPYDQSQLFLFPISVEKMIPEVHLVRIVNHVVESLDMETLSGYYCGEGRPPYHPKLMLKVWLYGYCEQIYTGRLLAKALREHLYFIWLSGNQQPCFKTLASFRSGRMKGLIKEVFIHLLSYLYQQGYIDLEDLFVDGTKIEANSNKHKKVWRKNTERYMAQVRERIDALWEKIEGLNLAEDQEYGKKDLPEMGEGKSIQVELSSEELGTHIQSLNELLAQKEEEGKKKAEVKEGKKWARHLVKEQAQLAKYAQNQAMVSDAGYGSEENYHLLEEKGFEAYVKYPLWYREKTGKMDKKPFHAFHFHYLEEEDQLICP